MESSETSIETASTTKVRKRKLLVWFVGVILGAITILSVSATVHKNSAYQSKVDSMTALAERIIPESDWIGGKTAIIGKSSCVSFDQDCHVLFRNWEAEIPVDIEKMADQLGIPMEHTQYPEDCMTSTDDGGRTEICAYESKSRDNWQVSLRIRQR